MAFSGGTALAAVILIAGVLPRPVRAADFLASTDAAAGAAKILAARIGADTGDNPSTGSVYRSSFPAPTQPALPPEGEGATRPMPSIPGGRALGLALRTAGELLGQSPPESQPPVQPGLAQENSLPSRRHKAGPSRLEIAGAQLADSRLGFLIGNWAEPFQRLRARASPRDRRVLLYTGQFDPFHNSHREELLGAQALGRFDEVIVAPSLAASGRPPTEPGAAWLRMLIARKSLEEAPGVRVDSLILRRGLLGAPEAVRAFQRRLGSKTAITLLMGSDNFRSLERWSGARELLDSADLMINLRPEYPIAPDPRIHLPETMREEYLPLKPGLYHNARTGRTLSFVEIPTDGVTSYQVLLAAQRRLAVSPSALLGPAGARLVERFHYGTLDLEGSDAHYRAARRLRPLLERALGSEAADILMRDWKALESLQCGQSQDPEATALVAQAVYRAIRDSRAGLARFPLLYSQAVQLALDPELGQVWGACTRERPAPPRAPPPAQHRGLGIPRQLTRLYWDAIATLQGISLASIIRTRSSSELARLSKDDQRVRLYVGIDPPFDEQRIRRDGLASRYSRLKGIGAREALLARLGERALALAHFRGDYRASAFVAATLSPRVAEAFAGPGGIVVTLDAPLSEVVFANDPQVWQGTVFERTGNPNDYLAEAVLREIRPEWILDALPAVAPGWRPPARERLRAWAEILARPLLERARGRAQP